MALFYVTGAPGAGKSTIQNELRRRGFEAVDLDNSGLGGLHNKQSGERTTVPPADQRTPEWFDAHEWRIDLQAVEVLKQNAKDKDIFLCGVAESDSEMLHLFDKILYLALSDDVLRGRVLSRVDNDFGKNNFELRTILERKHRLDVRYRDVNVITIDASRSLIGVVDDIIALTR